MKRLFSFLKSSMLRLWFMITAILTVFSACPCCGKPACPIGFGGATVLGGLLVVVGRVWLQGYGLFTRYCKAWSCEENTTK